MKPFAVFSTLTVVSVIAAVLAMYLVLGLLEERLGTPVVSRSGEEPFAYDTDVMPFVPCCGSVFYLIAANALYPALLASTPTIGRRWWIVTGLVLAVPFAIPVLLILSAIFIEPQAP